MYYTIYSHRVSGVLKFSRTFKIILMVNFCICLFLRKQLDFQILGFYLAKPIEELNWEVT